MCPSLNPHVVITINPFFFPLASQSNEMAPFRLNTQARLFCLSEDECAKIKKKVGEYLS